MTTPSTGPSNVSQTADAAIAKATRASGKTYVFAEQHDPRQPIDCWFQNSDEGLVLFVVFYTQACRWSLCSGCNLPSVSSQHHVGYQAIIGQIDNVLGHSMVRPRLADIRKVIVSNNGSVLDEVTFPSTALMYLITQLNLHLPAMDTLSFETRPEYVDIEELLFLSRAMCERKQPATVELAVGFEALDDNIRNRLFRKGLTLATFEQLVDKLREPQFRLKCYFMLKPVAGLSDEQAVEDIHRAIDYLDETAGKYGVTINMHLNPTYVAGGTRLAEAFADGEYAPPRLSDVVRAVLHGEGKRITIFAGLNDEGLAVADGSFIRRGDGPLIEALESFNRTQDYDALRQAL